MEASPELLPLFDRVVSHIQELGYGNGLLQRDYCFPDWFNQHHFERTADAVAFGQKPPSYSTACIAVVTPTVERQGLNLVSDFRALGAPFAFEVRKDDVAYWRVTTKPQSSDLLAILSPNEIGPFFTRERAELAPRELLRAKNLSTASGPQQLELDWTLIPALEAEIRGRLDPLLRDTLGTAQRLLESRGPHRSDVSQLYRSVFWLIAGKVLRDREVSKFKFLGDKATGLSVISEVAGYYGETAPPLPKEVADFIKERIWASLDFRHLSAEVLALIYENTLVDDVLRKTHGIHSTPTAVAKYVVSQLPFENLTIGSRKVVEACCGHGSFLLASMSRLRDLLPADMTPSARHTYLRERLTGFELDPFAAEVCRLSLMLADFPNRNAWQLFSGAGGNVLTSPEFVRALSTANVVLCNPPYRDMNAIERRCDPHHSVTFPIALLHRVLDLTSRSAMMGFVLPRKVMDGRGFRDVRKRIASRFRSIEVTSLPDQGVFANAQIEVALLIASEPTDVPNDSVSLTYGIVEKRDWPKFSGSRQVTRSSTLARTVEEAAESFGIPDLHAVWSKLSRYQTLEGVTTRISRGVEWDIPFAPNRSTLVSDRPKAGFAKGLVGSVGEMTAFCRPKISYLNVESKYHRNNAFDYDWGKVKVIINANRKSRGRWRTAAFVDDEGLVCYQTFTAIWPNSAWPPKVIAAILNGIVANCYISAYESARHITLVVLGRIPVPEISDINVRRVTQLVDEYVEVSSRWDFAAPPTSRTLADVLNDLDAEILDAYRLPRDSESMLRDYLRFEVRPVTDDARLGGWWTESADRYEVVFSPTANRTIKALESSVRTEVLGVVDRLQSGPIAVDAREIPSDTPGTLQYLCHANAGFMIVITVQPGRTVRVEDVLSKSTVKYFL